jgi:hypothetical protein
VCFVHLHGLCSVMSVSTCHHFEVGNRNVFCYFHGLFDVAKMADVDSGYDVCCI